MSPPPSILRLGAAGLAMVPAVAPAAAQAQVWRFADQHALGAPATYLVTAGSHGAAMAAVAAARAEIARLDRIFNSRRPGSELVALNDAPEMAVSPELFELLEAAEALRLSSGGAFNPGLGAALRLWREARDTPPSRDEALSLALAAQAPLRFVPETRTVLRPEGVSLDLDGMAKGYIIDKALAAGLATGLAHGMLVDIGGDMRGAGAPASPRGWTVGLPDPELPFLDAPLVAEVRLGDQAIATSGRGPRDRMIGGERFSVTLSPDTGWPVQANIAATVVAPCAAEADALATALLVRAPEAGLDLAERMPGVQARITAADGRVHASSGWRTLAEDLPPRLIRTAAARAPAAAVRRPSAPAAAAPKAAAAANTPAPWLPDWAVQIVYSAPGRDVARRAADFREPYMAMWISDTQNRPIRTLVLVGQDPEWQRDNYVWWNLYRDRARRLVELRSTATALSGNYPTFWPGYNDDWKYLPQGDYVLHIETSRERGQHTHRRIPLKIGSTPFEISIPPTEDGGSLKLVYARRR